eukprot:m51a1_g11175 putative eukaryotic translation initiation factor 3 subunit g (265) ;mRNA; f:312608-313813
MPLATEPLLLPRAAPKTEEEIKEVEEIRTLPTGQKVKVIKRVKVVKLVTRVPERVIARRAWQKFGACAGVGPGPEPGLTEVGDEVTIEAANKAKAAQETALAKTESEMLAKDGVGDVKCRICKGNHWTSKCPLRAQMGDDLDDIDGKKTEEPAAAGSSGKYVPPSKRGGPGAKEGSRPGRDDSFTIRVRNLNEDCREMDLQELFRPFGPLQRVFVAKDTRGHAKGFAFVNFYNKEDAEVALEKLRGVGFQNVILDLEWARPSNK